MSSRPDRTVARQPSERESESQRRTPSAPSGARGVNRAVSGNRALATELQRTAARPDAAAIIARAVGGQQVPSGNRAVARLASGRAVTGRAESPPVSAAATTAPKVQSLLSVSRPFDPLEREADAVAKHVARSTSTPSGPVARSAPSSPQRQSDAVTDTAAGPGVIPDAVEHVVTNPGSGEPLDPTLRARLEPHLEADLADVRVHREPRANVAAALLHARAFTYGKDVFLGAGESPSDLELMAHEATHVVQQQAVEVYRNRLCRYWDFDVPNIDIDVQDLIPDAVLARVADAARSLPGYELLTQILGSDPIAGTDVDSSRETIVEKLLTQGPFGEAVASVLGQLDIIGDVFTVITDGLATHNLTVERLQTDIDQAWDEFAIGNGIDGNLAIVERKIDAIIADVDAFVDSIVDTVLALVRSVVAEVVEPMLESDELGPVWGLTTKVLQVNPLTGEGVDAPTAEIIADFLRLIGQEQALDQMQQRGTLQETADWLDKQLATFSSLLAELGLLFSAAWAAIQPENLPNLMTDLASLAQRVFGFIGRVADFAETVFTKVVELLKHVLLGLLSDFAHDTDGFHIVTVILGKDPFTEEPVPRTAENIIRGFILLLPGGAAQYQQLAEAGVIEQAGSRIESALADLGISWEYVQGLFRDIWESLSLEDLADPMAAFQRILSQFGEPITRIFAFIQVVVGEVIKLILALTNAPTDVVESIFNNAMQAFEDIKADPVGFLQNMMETLKAGFQGFFDHITDYLLQGLTDWLFRGLRDAGIEPPTDLSLESILDLVLQVLGLTMDRLWELLADNIGQENVDRIRGAIDQLSGAWSFVQDVQEGGLGAIWEHIQSQISGLWDMLLDKAMEWITENIITRVTARLLSMLDPTGVMAVVNSFVAFFNAIQSAIEYIRDMLDIVNDYTTTMAAVARGDLGPGAEKLEQGLASSIPVAIGFLANQVGLGNIAERISEIIESIREVIDRALEWLMAQASRLGNAALGAFRPSSDAANIVGTPPTSEISALDEEPGDVRTQALNQVAADLESRQATSFEEVRTVLDDVMSQLQEHGLTSLTFDPTSDETPDIRILASASPVKDKVLRWDDAFGETAEHEGGERLAQWLEEARETDFARAASFRTRAVVSLNGAALGETTNANGNHAEQNMLQSGVWASTIARAEERASADSSTPVQVNLVVSKFPCSSICTPALSYWNPTRVTSRYRNLSFVLAAPRPYSPQYDWQDLVNEFMEWTSRFGEIFRLVPKDDAVLRDHLEALQGEERRRARQFIGEHVPYIRGVGYSDEETSPADINELRTAGWNVRVLQTRDVGFSVSELRLADKIEHALAAVRGYARTGRP